MRCALSSMFAEVSSLTTRIWTVFRELGNSASRQCFLEALLFCHEKRIPPASSFVNTLVFFVVERIERGLHLRSRTCGNFAP